MSEMLINCYKAIETASSAMLQAAQLRDWDEVARHEGRCAVLIEQLRERARHEQLAPDLRLEKKRIMQRILNIDAQIRYLSEPWLAHLDPAMDEPRGYLH